MLYVVLVATRNPLNIGAVARAMSNFGFLRLRVVNPYEVAWREARSAVGAAELLAQAEEFKTVADAISDCTLVVGTTAATNRELHHPLRTLAEAGRLLRPKLATRNVAVLFGSEKRGLSAVDLDHCHWLLRIPTRPEHASMNLGQAVAICLYELVRDAKPALKSENGTTATAGELERLKSVLIEALTSSGYIKARTAAATEAKVRRLIRRMNLQADDAELLLGMLRKVVWRLTTPSK
jgi:TrmH family RNA methyltransferase